MCDAACFSQKTSGPNTMTAPVSIRYLAEHPESLSTLQAWFESEWPSYYSSGGRGNARQDLLSYSNRGCVPVGLIAIRGSELCGIAALKNEPFPSQPHLSPWVGAALVKPSMRRQGIGRLLIQGLESEAKALGQQKIYCATATSATLLERCAWQLIERIQHEGQHVCVYEKTL
jgi:GNAT superfamily N-acetyltransferase